MISRWAIRVSALDKNGQCIAGQYLTLTEEFLVDSPVAGKQMVKDKVAMAIDAVRVRIAKGE